MKILKVLKHDKKTYIHIKDHVDNHGYIISTLAVTLMSLQESLKDFSVESYELHFKIPTSYSSNLGIIDMLVEGTLPFKEKLELVLAYNNHISKLDNIPNVIEVIDVIDTVKPQPIITPRGIDNKPFKPSDNKDGWTTRPNPIGHGGWGHR